MHQQDRFGTREREQDDDPRKTLYEQHSGPGTIAPGNLRSDLTLKQLVRACRIVFAKKSLPRKKLPIRLDLTPFESAGFIYDTASTEAVAQQLSKLPLGKKGMKLLYSYNGELRVKFYGIRHVDIDYESLVEHVDISRVGDCFRDVLGINTKIIKRDKQERPVLQIERIAALAQPNYAAFLGKDELDVYKLEFQQYESDRVVNWMRTVCSPNASTVTDDSYLSFSRGQNNCGANIEFVALQEFPLPRIMVFLGLSQWRWLRETLTYFAYKRFWRDTSENIVRCFKRSDQRSFKIPKTQNPERQRQAG